MVKGKKLKKEQKCLLVQMERVKREVLEHGYSTIEAMTTERAHELRDKFKDWRNDRNLYSIHGIIKSYGVGQADFMWEARHAVKWVFEEFWDEKDLVVSFDGAGYYKANGKKYKEGKKWAHCDQNPKRNPNFELVQGVLYLEDCLNECDGGFMCWPGTHESKKPDVKGDFVSVPQTENGHVVHAKAGTLVLFDSRVIHANQAPKGSDAMDRVCAYICMAPRSQVSKRNLEKRQKYYYTNRTTSHSPINIHVNADSLRFPGWLDPKEEMARIGKPNDNKNLELV